MKQRNYRKTGNGKIFAVFFVLALLFGGVQIFFAPVSNDEAFYLTIPQRLLNGDAFFVQEWHLSQLSGLVLMPFLFLYRLIVPSQTGILLAFRFIYLVVHAVIAYALFAKLRKYGVGAMLASIVYLLYTPVGIPALSYNTIGLGALVLVCVLLIEHNDTRYPVISGILIGILLSLAVLCCPHLVFVYIIYSAVVLFLKIKNKNNTKIRILTAPVWRTVTFGCLFVFAIFLAVLITRSSLTQIVQCFPHMFNDPEHKSALLFPLTRFIFGFFIRHKWLIAALSVGLIGFCVCIFIVVKDKNRMWHRGIYLTIVSIPVIFCNVVIALFLNNISYTMVAINLTGLVAFAFTERKGWQWLVFWIVGIAYAYCLFLGSNTGLGALTQGISIATIGSIFMICDCIAEMNLDKPRSFPAIVLAVVLILQPISQAVAQSMSKIVSLLNSEEVVSYDFGCKAGIVAPKARVEMDRQYYLDIKPILLNEDSSVLYMSFKIWMYMCSDNPLGTYSAWLAGVNEHTYARLLEYYEINPHKIPDFIYLDLDYPWCKENYQRVARELGYIAEEKTCGYLLTKAE